MNFRTLLPILVLIALVGSSWFAADKAGVPIYCKTPWGTNLCIKYMQEQQLKALEEISRNVKGGIK